MDYTVYQLLWLFLFYSFLGWLAETVLAALKRRRLLNRGFLSAPFSPTYGLGALLFAIFLPELREDIHDLASSIDDVIDGINSSAKRITIYNPRPISDSGKELSLLIQQEAHYISKAMDELETFRKKPTTLRDYCTKLHDIENQADDVYELFITKLFEEEKDSIELIKIKEIMHELEKTTDAAEHVGKILRNLIVKYA